MSSATGSTSSGSENRAAKSGKSSSSGSGGPPKTGDRTSADVTRKSFVGRSLGVMIVGVLLNEETPSWGDVAIGGVIYLGESGEAEDIGGGDWDADQGLMVQV